MNIQSEGEDVRKAVRWFSEEQKFNSEKSPESIAEEACIRFDLSPLDAEFLGQFARKTLLSSS